MADAAAWLPIALIPEQILITAMRDDVVDDLCRNCPASGLAAQAERMLCLEGEAGPIPPSRVAALSC